MRDSLSEVIEKLNWLRMVAPTPAAQKKYTSAAAFLGTVRDHWVKLAGQLEREVALSKAMNVMSEAFGNAARQ